MLEREYQRGLIGRLEKLFPGCEIIRNDPSRRQGVPDLLILYGERWAMLELKRRANSTRQPNQEYWVDRYRQMSFAAVIHPENEEEVLRELQHAFGSVG